MSAMVAFTFRHEKCQTTHWTKWQKQHKKQIMREQTSRQYKADMQMPEREANDEINQMVWTKHNRKDMKSQYESSVPITNKIKTDKTTYWNESEHASWWVDDTESVQSKWLKGHSYMSLLNRLTKGNKEKKKKKIKSQQSRDGIYNAKVWERIVSTWLCIHIQIQ